jgi:iron complex transport system substrate-binding protein
LLCVLIATLPVWCPAEAARRVVSLNLCTDELLVLLAPEQVAALTYLARDPALSVVAAEAARFPAVRASAEAVLAFDPDLVLAAPWGARAALAVLERHDVAVLRVDLPSDFAGIRAETRRVAAALDVAARGEALLALMDSRLDAANRRAPAEPPRALTWEPRGYSAGAGSLGNAVLLAAGYANAAPDGRRRGLESLLADPPDLLVVPSRPAFPSLATDLLDHPALWALPRVEIPPALTLCPGPWTAEAVTLLAR